MSTRIRLVILAVTAVLHSSPAWPLGLGDARVQSFIGQPLELHIDLLTSPGDDLDSVSARLASAEDFALIGASREAISVPLAFQVREGEGREGAYILVTSRLAVSNPVLRLVVEVNWSSGRMLREYTVFLDPPTVPSQAPAPAVSQTRDLEPVSQPSTDPATVPAQARTEPAVSDAPPPAVSQANSEIDTASATPQQPSDTQGGASSRVDSGTADTTLSEHYGPVQDGQTLWQIATSQMGQSGFDMSQVMMAIQRKNPNAFVNGNINLLMRGATLELPTAAEVSEISSAEARAMVAQQEAAFRMRSSLASASTPLLAGESPRETADDLPAGESGVTEAEGGESAGLEETVSRLEIVPASEEDLAGGETGTGSVPAGEGSDEVAADIREELARTEEALISAQQENVYLQERIAELESQLGETEGRSEGLIADEELADLEDRLEAERLANEDDSSPVAELAESEVPRVVTSKADEPDRPWYSGPMTWIIMVIIVLAAVIGWIFNRRRAAAHYESGEEDSAVAVSGLKDEAEDILRALDSDRDKDSGQESPAAEDDPEAGGGEEKTPGGEEPYQSDESATDTDSPAEAPEPTSSEVEKRRRSHQKDQGDARVLDENSSDPEIQLDLARAYISMGDKEAARAILDEVLNLGNEEQKAEARSMMDKI